MMILYHAAFDVQVVFEQCCSLCDLLMSLGFAMEKSVSVWEALYAGAGNQKTHGLVCKLSKDQEDQVHESSIDSDIPRKHGCQSAPHMLSVC